MSIWWRNKRVFISISFELVKNFLDHSLNREKERKKADCLFEAIYESIFMPTCDNRCAHVDDFCFLSSLFVYWHCECDVCASVFASSAAYFFVIISFYWKRDKVVCQHTLNSFLFWMLLLFCIFISFGQLRREENKKQKLVILAPSTACEWVCWLFFLCSSRTKLTLKIHHVKMIVIIYVDIYGIECSCLIISLFFALTRAALFSVALRIH